MADALKRSLAPLLAAALFAALQLYGRDWLGGDGPPWLFRYALPIGCWLSGAWLAARLLNVVFWDHIVHRRLGRPAPRLLHDLLNVVILLVAVSGILSNVFGLMVTGILAASSALAVVVGLALRNTILDVFTGLAVNLDRSYQIGDWLEVHHRDFKQPAEGKIVEINWRTTRLQTRDGSVIVIPNNVMSTAMTTNYSLPSHLSRFHITVPLDFAVPTARAKRVLLAGARAAVGPQGPVESPPPEVLVGAVGEHGVAYTVRYWLDVDRLAPVVVESTVAASVLEHLRVAGLAPAHPKQDAYLGRLPAPQPEPASDAGRAALLRRVELFARSLTADELDALAARMQARSIKAGVAVIRQGEPGCSMFIVAEGLLDVRVGDAASGPSLRVNRLGPCACFGEMSLLTGEPRSATVVALTDALAFEIDKDDVLPLLQARPAIAERLSRLVAERRAVAERAREGDHQMPPDDAATATLSRQILRRMRSVFRLVLDSRAAS